MAVLDSKLLFKLLQKMCSEVNEKNLEYFLIAKPNVVKCLLYGNNNTGKAYWPNHGIWVKNAYEILEECDDNTDWYADEGISQLIRCCPTTHTEVTSLERQVTDLIDNIFYEYYDNNLSLIKKEITRLLSEMGLERAEISYIESAQDLPLISAYLVNRAKNKGRTTVSTPAEIPEKNQTRSISGIAYPLTRNLPSILPAYLPRNTELTQLETFLEQGHKHIFITGEGGLGKTEFAIAGAQLLKDRYEFFYVTYGGSLRETLCTLQFKGLPLKSEDIYAQKMQLLEQYGENAVLIIDNYDAPQQQLLAELSQLPNLEMRLLITTRTELQGKAQISITPFPVKMLISLIRTYNPGRYRDEELDRLVQTLHSHTLLVDVVARLLQQSIAGITIDTLLKNLKEYNWQSELLEESVPSEYNRQFSEKTVLGYLCALFDTSKLSTEARYVLSCASLLSVDGLNEDVFAVCFKNIPNYRSVIRSLRSEKWLRYDLARGIYSLHPLIQAVCLSTDTAMPKWPECKPFWEAIIQFPIHPIDGRLNRQCLAVLSNLLSLLEKTQDHSAYAATLLRMGKFYEGLWDKDNASAFYRKYLAVLQKHFPGDYPAIAGGYGRLCRLCMSDYSVVEDLAQRALNLPIPPDHSALADVYYCMGGVYRNKECWETALKYAMKCLDIREREPSSDQLDLWDSYSLIGSIYSRQKHYQQAVVYWLRSAEVLEQHTYMNVYWGVLNATYLQIGHLYKKLGRYDEEQIYRQKAEDAWNAMSSIK